jgi:hypothetical protein
MLLLASLTKEGESGSFFGKARKMNHLSFFCERSEQKTSKFALV